MYIIMIQHFYLVTKQKMNLLNYVTIDYLVEVVWMFFAYAGIVIMIVWWIKAIYLLVYRWFIDKTVPMGKIRIKLGHYLVLALEFLVAKDILESIVDPNMNGLLMLGLIVVIRTVLSYFLNKEIAEVKEDMEKEGEMNDLSTKSESENLKLETPKKLTTKKK